MSDAAPALVLIAAYDRREALRLLRDISPSALRAELVAGHFGGRLTASQRARLDQILLGWEQRALGRLALRDALLVDQRNGREAYGLICAALTAERTSAARAALPPGGPLPADLPDGAAALISDPGLTTMLRRAAAQGLSLVVQTEATAFPLPPELDQLLPEPPSPARPRDDFQPPSGRRRLVSALLATIAIALMGTPLLVGSIPRQPAGVPLALLTLALLIGIRAGPTGYLGSLCIWLVANLPGFRHGTDPQRLLPAVPLITAGLLMLWADRQVRTMWRWLRRRLGPR